MNKIGAVIIVVAVVAVAYILLLLFMPVLVDVVETANTTMANATANFTTVYPGTGELTVATPWIMLFVPGVIGIIVVVMILRKP